MNSVEPAPQPEPLLTTTEMAAVDRAAVASGLPLQQLIANAGAAVADSINHRFGQNAHVAVLCGPGNNGCDGYLAGAALARAGHHVEIFSEHSAGAAGIQAWAVAQWAKAVSPLARFQPHRHACVVDALYGAGLSRPIFGIEAEAVGWVNAAEAFVVAVDVPSGLNGDTGQTLGACVEADQTITFFRRKPGHVLWPGRGLCGQLLVADIGIAEAHLAIAATPTHVVNGPALWRSALPDGPADNHKYQRGHVLVVSGSELETGASRLSAIAAQHAGAGAVSIAGDREALRIHAAHVTAIMLKEAASSVELEELLRRRTFSAAVIGPAAGVTDLTRDRINVLLSACVPTVLDADALTCLVGQASRLAARPHGRPSLVLTPHAGEFDRLFGPELSGEPTYQRLSPTLQLSKVEKARAAARITQSVIVFKGIDTVIADSDGRVAINDNAGPELATAGSGDVLAGLIACHLAQGMRARDAAAAGVWLHGAAGAQLGLGLTAEMLASGVRPLATKLGSV